ncbi:MAG: hypothetical protein KUG67_03385, partial [Proteobacteria bacterium]|nr:hypothetical protein [Pseudomonadota bacterium]
MFRFTRSAGIAAGLGAVVLALAVAWSVRETVDDSSGDDLAAGGELVPITGEARLDVGSTEADALVAATTAALSGLGAASVLEEEAP